MEERPKWTSVSTSYVQPRNSDEPDAWTEEAARQGGAGASRILDVAEVQPPTPIAESLRLRNDEKAVVRRRLVSLDGEPIELADSYYPLPVAQGTPLAESRKIRGGAVTVLAGLGYHAHRVVEKVSCRPANQREQEALRLNAGDWVLVLNRVVYARDETPFEVTVMTMVADGRDLRYEMIAG
ncbi:UTRA domain-containing protein [Nonomuraea sp. RK-328]|nr:UTRA domain-containing protein [Nonomuraea sp. RK-328]